MNLLDLVKVKIDLRKLAMNLRTSDGATVAEGTVRAFMKYSGFNLDDEGNWVGPRSELRRFNPGEVVGVEPA